MKLTLTYKTVFGRDSYYPSDDISRNICHLGGFKTFTQEQVDYMKREGWELDINGFIPA